ncbi:MAG: STAS domain-containing protein [Sedimentisphaerales bacterium]|jgi:stage II sporulation protein AA (anti-sigma F factor antagonist)|nr:STAS domain-containing protein [Sedimentisphaerales bacterium]
MEQDQPLEVRTDGQTVVIRLLVPTITDPQHIARISETVNEVIARQKPRVLVFDFELVRFFTSQILGILLQARQALQPLGGKVVIKSLSTTLKRVFRVTYLERFFEFSDKDQMLVER